jgi:NTP pyrophosphatase (non-canonical NTP hydrolase)
LLTFKTLQDEVAEWTTSNFANTKFGPRGDIHPFMGVVEEVGELSHALLKSEQGIRGTQEEHEAAAKDAVGDIYVYLADLCGRKGWDSQAIIEEVWAKVVQKRNWNANPQTGVVIDGGTAG